MSTAPIANPPDSPRLLGELFVGRSSPTARLAMRSDGDRTERSGLTTDDLHAHVIGRTRFGAVPFVDAEHIGWGCIDLDVKPMDIGTDSPEALAIVDGIAERLGEYGIRPAIERSKSKGWHVWVFFETPAPARDVRTFLRRIALDAGAGDEPDLVCPRQDRLYEGGVGNGTWVPLFGGDTNGRTRFWTLDPDSMRWTEAPDQGAVVEELLQHPTPAELIPPAADNGGSPSAQPMMASDGHPCDWILDELDENDIKLEAVALGRGKIMFQCPLHTSDDPRAHGGSAVFFSGGNGQCSSTRCDRRWRSVPEFLDLLRDVRGHDPDRPSRVAEPESRPASEADGLGAGGPAGKSLFPSHFFDDRGLVVERLGRVIQDEGNLRLGKDGCLYRYQGGVYRSDGDSFTKVRVRELLADRFKRRHAEEVLTWLRAHYPTIAEKQPQEFLNVRNGLLDWKAGELLPHPPSVVSTAQLTVRWQPDARCPRIEKFLTQVIPPDALDFVLELIGYMLYSGNPLRVAVLLLGPGGNGKSVLLAVIRSLLGDENVSAIPLQALAENRFAAAELFGKIANICGDLDARAVKQTDTFKAWTGGDPVMAERKHRDPFTFRPIAVPIFSANEAPLSSDQTEAWFDRWVIVPMERRISPKQMDPHLVAKLTTPEELEGLLVLAVAGLRRLLARGRFDLPTSVEAARGDYRERLDSVQGFVSEACRLDVTAWTVRKDLYTAYRIWAQDSGRFPVSAATFYDYLRRGYPERVADRAREGIRGFAGIRLAEVGS
jgi:P4 family phage/plasmid primase-like protien